MSLSLIRRCKETDLDTIWAIINDGAQVYQGEIPADCLPHPYMSRQELQQEIAAGVQFWGYEENGILIAVMGIQAVQDVTLIRHAYVQSGRQKQGIGGQLLRQLLPLARGPVLVGTWAEATWAIRFYERHGFELVDWQAKERLLRTYWHVPERQVEASVVLANQHWRHREQVGTPP